MDVQPPKKVAYLLCRMGRQRWVALGGAGARVVAAGLQHGGRWTLGAAVAIERRALPGVAWSHPVDKRR